MTIITWIAAFITGILASKGVGGGMLLIIWMTAGMGMNQFDAQGINLLFFIPIALFSVIKHRKNGLIDIKPVIPSVITGIAGTVLGFKTAEYIGTDMLKDIFSVFILFMGFREIYNFIVRKREKSKGN